MSFRNLSFAKKILIPTMGATLAFAGVLVLVHRQVRDYAYGEKQRATRDLVELATGIVTRYGAAEAKGAMNRDAAQKAAIGAIRDLRYGSGGYFWINDLQPRMIMHPIDPALDGKDLAGYRDPTGVPIFIKMVDICRSAGAGMVRYSWPRPGSSEPVPKISYVRKYAPWDWVIGSGVYVDDVQAEMAALSNLSFGLMILTAIGCGTISFILVRMLSRQVETIAMGLSAVSNQVSDAARAVLHTSESIASGAGEQAGHVHETNESIRELARAISTSCTDAAPAESLVGEVCLAVETGRKRMDAMSAAISGIAAASKQGSNIARTIADIAFQTKLLAFNAAVEAARVGEAGVGFAVVADQVAELAQSAARAAQESNQTTEESLRKSREGAAITNDVIAEFESVVENVRAVSNRAKQIAATASEQRQRVEQIGNAGS